MSAITEVTEPVRTVTPDDVLFEEAVTETPVEAQILENAADILEREGWAQGAFALHGRYCAVGGIGSAMRRMTFARGTKAKSRRAAEAALAELIRESNGSPYSRNDKDEIICWNDSGLRKKDQVIRKFREAAARLTGV